MTCRNRRCMLILVTVAVIVTMSISLGAASYDPQAAYNYAQKYAYTAVSDGHFYGKDGIPIHIPAGTPIINDGLDCAHFVSSAIGNQQNEKGGGLDIYSATKLPYGSASTTGLWNYLIDKKLGVKVSSGVEANDILQLERGDIINYDFPNDGKGWSHTALYLRGFKGLRRPLPIGRG